MEITFHIVFKILGWYHHQIKKESEKSEKTIQEARDFYPKAFSDSQKINQNYMKLICDFKSRELQRSVVKNLSER
jgi:hypothetical protein